MADPTDPVVVDGFVLPNGQITAEKIDTSLPGIVKLVETLKAGYASAQHPMLSSNRATPPLLVAGKANYPVCLCSGRPGDALARMFPAAFRLRRGAGADTLCLIIDTYAVSSSLSKDGTAKSARDELKARHGANSLAEAFAVEEVRKAGLVVECMQIFRFTADGAADKVSMPYKNESDGQGGKKFEWLRSHPNWYKRPGKINEVTPDVVNTPMKKVFEEKPVIPYVFEHVKAMQVPEFGPPGEKHRWRIRDQAELTVATIEVLRIKYDFIIFPLSVMGIEAESVYK